MSTGPCNHTDSHLKIVCCDGRPPTGKYSSRFNTMGTAVGALRTQRPHTAVAISCSACVVNVRSGDRDRTLGSLGSTNRIEAAGDVPFGTARRAFHEMPLLSFIVPTLDRQAKVTRAVASILNQNFKGDLEVVIVDDGSSPPISVPPELATDPRVRIVRKDETSGPGAARNSGLMHVQGQWVGFLDSDDYLLPDTLNQRFADAIEDQARRAHRLVLYTCGWAEVSEGGMIQRVRHPRAPTSQEGFAGGCWFCAGSTLLFPRAPVLEAVGLQDERPPRLEDCDWTLRFGLAKGELVVQPVVAVAIEISSRPSAWRLMLAAIS